MRISIITVCLNAEKTVERTIQSVVHQNVDDLEYIIIDGKSEDGTIDIIKKYSNYITYWVSEPDNGIYHGMNKGIKKATGDVIGIINSDDWYEPDALKIVQGLFEDDEDIDILFGDLYMVNNGIKKEFHYSRASFITMWRQMAIGHPATFLRREVYEKIGMFDETYAIAGDYDLMFRCWNSRSTFAHAKAYLANFSTSGVSFVNTDLSLREMEQISVKYLDKAMFRECVRETGVDLGRGVYLWGDGYIGNLCRALLHHCYIKISGFFDNNEAKHGVKQGLCVKAFTGREAELNLQIIVTVESGYESIQKQINELDMNHDIVLIDYHSIWSLYEQKLIELNGICIEKSE